MVERLTWCEVSAQALRANLAEFRRLVGPACRLAPVVKANAYGHGLVPASRVLADAGADVLCVNDLWEASVLREAGLALPLHVVGRVPPEQAGDAVALDASVVAYDAEVLAALDGAGRATGRVARAHLKVETGTNRQGVGPGELRALCRLAAGMTGVRVTGLSTHFADIEDTTDHGYAREQMARFREAAAIAAAEGLVLDEPNLANSAATILWPESHLAMVRVGIAVYGMWPSKETLVSAALAHRDRIVLRPALAWKTRIAQVKEVAAGDWIGYGRSYRTTHATRLAVLPVGYYDGYDRKLSNLAYVLVGGRRAPVRGRICMNMTLVDVTDVPGARAGDEVVLLGAQGDDAVTAEQFASWADTINYEVTTRIAESIPRKII